MRIKIYISYVFFIGSLNIIWMEDEHIIYCDMEIRLYLYTILILQKQMDNLVCNSKF